MTRIPRRLIVITGPSGAGRTTATNALEDLGYETIDNIPLSVVPKVVDGQLKKSLVLGIDTRTRDFSISAFLDLIGGLRQRALPRPEILFLDCRKEILQRRFSETRRRHPLAVDCSPNEAISQEQILLAPMRDTADFVLDSSDLTPHDLKKQIYNWFAISEALPLTLSLQSFSYKKGLPRDLDMVLDCRFLKNPHWESALRPLDGLEIAISDYVKSDLRYQGFFDRSVDLIRFLLPAYQDEGKSHFAVGLGCTGGRHRSVFVAESLAQALAQLGGPVSIRRRELDQSEGT
jgi:UPF0042 nucleotide-binding protein